MYVRAATQKRQWVRNHLSKSIHVIPMMGGANKYLFMNNPGDLLIDDYEKNCVPWEKAGGNIILHKDAKTTREKLEKLI